MTTTRFDLDRFVAAQAGSYATALAELRNGRKQGHWMWYVFPQIEGLGSSTTARRYAIASLGEAQAYLAHPVLSDRLLAVVAALQDLPPQDAAAVLGPIDAIKLRSSLTLFVAAGGPPILHAALHRWFDGRPDDRTLALLAIDGDVVARPGENGAAGED